MAKLITNMLVESVTPEAPETNTLRLRWPEGYDVSFKTGQFLTLFWPDTPQYKRAYSLSSCALDRGFFEVTIKREGKMGTRMVDWAQTGDILGVLPPAGKFLPVLENDKHLICIAGGSGVAPFRGFVREAILRQLTTRITVLYSVRTTRDIIFKDEFAAMAQKYPHLDIQITCTRLDAGENWNGRCGRLDVQWIKSCMTQPEKTVFYACGPNGLVETVEHLVLHELAFPKEQIKTEKWG